MEIEYGQARLTLEMGDITRVRVDAIVNAANSALVGGGGVDGAIHAVGGPALMRELDKIRVEQGGCPTGGAVVTGAGRLKARFVFHAVGPIWRGGHAREAELLAGCYRTCLALARENKCRSIAFPSISTGVYGYPVGAAAEIALATSLTETGLHAGKMETIRFVLFSQSILDSWQAAAREVLERFPEARFSAGD